MLLIVCHRFLLLALALSLPLFLQPCAALPTSLRRWQAACSLPVHNACLRVQQGGSPQSPESERPAVELQGVWVVPLVLLREEA